MTGQDAAKRAIEILVESVFHEHTQRSGHLVTLLATHVDAAVAEAVKEADERYLRHATYYEEALQEARREERERCARLVETQPPSLSTCAIAEIIRRPPASAPLDTSKRGWDWDMPRPGGADIPSDKLASAPDGEK